MNQDDAATLLPAGLDTVPGVDEESFAELEAFAGVSAPIEYAALLRLSNGLSGWLRDRYLIIYSAKEAIAANRAAEVKNTVPGMLIFASNGGGTSYLLETANPASAVLRCEDIDLGVEPPIYVANSIREFLRSFGPDIA